LNELKTSPDETPSLVKFEGEIARGADSLVIILASWLFLDAFLVLLGIVVGAHAFDASSIFVHLFAELIFRNTSSI